MGPPGPASAPHSRHPPNAADVSRSAGGRRGSEQRAACREGDPRRAASIQEPRGHSGLVRPVRPETDTRAMEVRHSLPLDSDRFMSQECPRCTRRFKVKPDELPLTKLAHCPYCEHDGEGCWWTPGQAAVIKAIGARMVAEQLNEGMRARGSKAWKPGPLPTVPDAPAEAVDKLPTVFTFACCGAVIRHDGESTSLRCVVCGTKVPLSP
jgi:DNA-directed RNA polymerase subunit RPC12/RpoP